MITLKKKNWKWNYRIGTRQNVALVCKVKNSKFPFCSSTILSKKKYKVFTAVPFRWLRFSKKGIRSKKNENQNEIFSTSSKKTFLIQSSTLLTRRAKALGWKKSIATLYYLLIAYKKTIRIKCQESFNNSTLLKLGIALSPFLAYLIQLSLEKYEWQYQKNTFLHRSLPAFVKPIPKITWDTFAYTQYSKKLNTSLINQVTSVDDCFFISLNPNWQFKQKQFLTGTFPIKTRLSMDPLLKSSPVVPLPFSLDGPLPFSLEGLKKWSFLPSRYFYQLLSEKEKVNWKFCSSTQFLLSPQKVIERNSRWQIFYNDLDDIPAKLNSVFPKKWFFVTKEKQAALGWFEDVENPLRLAKMKGFKKRKPTFLGLFRNEIKFYETFFTIFRYRPSLYVPAFKIKSPKKVMTQKVSQLKKQNPVSFSKQKLLLKPNLINHAFLEFKTPDWIGLRTLVNFDSSKSKQVLTLLTRRAKGPLKNKKLLVGSGKTWITLLEELLTKKVANREQSLFQTRNFQYNMFSGFSRFSKILQSSILPAKKSRLFKPSDKFGAVLQKQLQKDFNKFLTLLKKEDFNKALTLVEYEVEVSAVTKKVSRVNLFLPTVKPPKPKVSYPGLNSKNDSPSNPVIHMELKPLDPKFQYKYLKVQKNKQRDFLIRFSSFETILSRVKNKKKLKNQNFAKQIQIALQKPKTFLALFKKTTNPLWSKQNFLFSKPNSFFFLKNTKSGQEKSFVRQDSHKKKKKATLTLLTRRAKDPQQKKKAKSKKSPIANLIKNNKFPQRKLFRSGFLQRKMSGYLHPDTSRESVLTNPSLFNVTVLNPNKTLKVGFSNLSRYNEKFSTLFLSQLPLQFQKNQLQTTPFALSEQSTGNLVHFSLIQVDQPLNQNLLNFEPSLNPKKKSLLLFSTLQKKIDSLKFIEPDKSFTGKKESFFGMPIRSPYGVQLEGYRRQHVKESPLFSSVKKHGSKKIQKHFQGRYDDSLNFLLQSNSLLLKKNFLSSTLKPLPVTVGKTFESNSVVKSRENKKAKFFESASNSTGNLSKTVQVSGLNQRSKGPNFTFFFRKAQNQKASKQNVLTEITKAAIFSTTVLEKNLTFLPFNSFSFLTKKKKVFDFHQQTVSFQTRFHYTKSKNVRLFTLRKNSFFDFFTVGGSNFAKGAINSEANRQDMLSLNNRNSLMLAEKQTKYEPQLKIANQSQILNVLYQQPKTFFKTCSIITQLSFVFIVAKLTQILQKEYIDEIFYYITEFYPFLNEYDKSQLQILLQGENYRVIKNSKKKFSDLVGGKFLLTEFADPILLLRNSRKGFYKIQISKPQLVTFVYFKKINSQLQLIKSKLFFTSKIARETKTARYAEISLALPLVQNSKKQIFFLRYCKILNLEHYLKDLRSLPSFFNRTVFNLQTLLTRRAKAQWVEKRKENAFVENAGFKFQNVIPKGILLVGPPGCGKTLFVQALAGEASVPVIVESGQMLNTNIETNGTERLQDLFKAAREMSPCILFFDEIDTIGQKREKVLGSFITNEKENKIPNTLNQIYLQTGLLAKPQDSSHLLTENFNESVLNPVLGFKIPKHSQFKKQTDLKTEITNQKIASEKEQNQNLVILTQLLCELDGLTPKQEIIVIGATNRPSTLDPALTRPGRFGKVIYLGLPGKQKRFELLKFYSFSASNLSGLSNLAPIGPKNFSKKMPTLLTRRAKAPLTYEKTFLDINKSGFSRNQTLKNNFSNWLNKIGVDENINWNYFANQTIGLSSAHIAAAINRSALKAIFVFLSNRQKKKSNFFDKSFSHLPFPLLGKPEPIKTEKVNNQNNVLLLIKNKNPKKLSKEIKLRILVQVGSDFHLILTKYTSHYKNQISHFSREKLNAKPVSQNFVVSDLQKISPTHLSFWGKNFGFLNKGQRFWNTLASSFYFQFNNSTLVTTKNQPLHTFETIQYGIQTISTMNTSNHFHLIKGKKMNTQILGRLLNKDCFFKIEKTQPQKWFESKELEASTLQNKSHQTLNPLKRSVFYQKHRRYFRTLGLLTGQSEILVSLVQKPVKSQTLKILLIPLIKKISLFCIQNKNSKKFQVKLTQIKTLFLIALIFFKLTILKRYLNRINKNHSFGFSFLFNSTCLIKNFLVIFSIQTKNYKNLNFIYFNLIFFKGSNKKKISHSFLHWQNSNILSQSDLFGDSLFINRSAYYLSGKAFITFKNQINTNSDQPIHLWSFIGAVKTRQKQNLDFKALLTKSQLEQFLVSLIAGKAGETLMLSTQLGSQKKNSSTIGIEELKKFGSVSKLIIENYLFYSQKELTQKQMNSQLVENKHQIEQKEEILFLKELAALFEISNNNSFFSQKNSLKLYDPFTSFDQPWWQFKAIPLVVSLNLNYKKWYRLFVYEEQQNLRNIEWVAPDKTFHTQLNVNCLMPTKKASLYLNKRIDKYFVNREFVSKYIEFCQLNWNQLPLLESESLSSYFLFESFNKVFILLENNLEFIDFLVYSLLCKETLHTFAVSTYQKRFS